MPPGLHEFNAVTFIEKSRKPLRVMRNLSEGFDKIPSRLFGSSRH
jgi:hypothetical protein